MHKILTIIGTRPEAIKTSILHKLLLESENFDPVLVTTGQHSSLIVQTLNEFRISEYHRLSDEIQSNTIGEKCSEIIKNLERFISGSRPDLIIIQGDTLSSFCGSLVGFLNKIPVAHIEAGLRTGNKWGPFPEEIFRRFNDMTADLLFAPTETGKENLLAEGHKQENIFVTGNTSIDALRYAEDITGSDSYVPSQKLLAIVESIEKQNRIPCILTIHRREARGVYFTELLQQLSDLAQNCHLSYIFPVHPAPWIKKELESSSYRHIMVCPPISYLEFVWLMKNTKLIFTDSGGIQEEGPHLGKPVIVLRKESERQEALATGRNHFIQATTPDLVNGLLEESSRPIKVYGDGNASKIILGHIEKFLERLND